MVALGLIRHGKHHEDICLGGVGDKALGAVENVVVTLQNGHSLLTGGIRAGVRLSQAERAQLAAGQQVGQILHLLLLRAEGIDRVAAQGRVGSHNRSSRGAALCKFFNCHSIGKIRTALASVLFGEGNP